MALHLQVVTLGPRVIVEFAKRTLGPERKRRQISQLGGLKRSLAHLYVETCRVQIGIISQHLLDKLLQERVGKELAP